MIKTEEPIPQESSTSHCWKENPNCTALRVEPEDGGIFLLPYKHLGFSHYQTGEDDDQLAIFFATHMVTIKGRRLCGLLPALQKESLQWVRAIPERYEAIQGPEGVAIMSINVETYVRENEG